MSNICVHRGLASSPTCSLPQRNAACRATAIVGGMLVGGTLLLPLAPAFAGCNSGDTGTLLTSHDCQATASDPNATAVGLLASASGSESTAIGRSALAQGNRGTALGAESFAVGDNTTSVGYNSGSTGMTSGVTSVGANAGTGGTGTYATLVGGGTGSLSAPRAADWSVAVGGGDGTPFTPTVGPSINLNGAAASGFISTAVGTASQAIGGGSSAFGLGSQAIANDSSAYGEFSNAGGTRSVAIGLFSNASGANSSALGQSSSAGGANSNAGTVAIGSGAQAGTGAAGQTNATAVGAVAKANAAGSSAFGVLSSASGPSAVAIGNSANASMPQAVAIGYNSVANVANTVSVGRAGGERRVVNVANAVNPTDAVNLRQVQALIAAAPRTGSMAALRPHAADSQDSMPTQRRLPAFGRGAGTAGSDAHGRSPTPIADRVSAPEAAAASDEDDLAPSVVVGWANVGHDGTLSRSRNIVGNVRHGTGSYEIAFKKRSLLTCSYNAAITGAGFVSVSPGPTPNSLTVETRNHYGVLIDAAFYVMAVC